MTERVRIEQFLDASCAWCHGALETNRRVLDELAADPAIPPFELVWRWIRLHPVRESGAPLRAGLVEEALAFVTSVGVRLDPMRYTREHDPELAHRLLTVVRDDPARDALPGPWSLARAVLNATFVDGVDLTDLAALRGAVERHGMAVPERIWHQLDTTELGRSAVAMDHARARVVQLDGVPRMVVHGQIVPTWIDPDEVRTRLRAAILDGAAAPV